jgi:hypothetical protein
MNFPRKSTIHSTIINEEEKEQPITLTTSIYEHSNSYSLEVIIGINGNFYNLHWSDETKDFRYAQDGGVRLSKAQYDSVMKLVEDTSEYNDYFLFGK